MEWLLTLDALGTALGLIYLYLEYKASVRLWIVSMIMPAIDLFVYYRAGLYADFGMAIYYLLIAVYGWVLWTRKERRNALQKTPISSNAEELLMREKTNSLTIESKYSDKDGYPASKQVEKGERNVSHIPVRTACLAFMAFLVIWGAMYWVLLQTNSQVPLKDSFGNSLSIVALWMLAQKYAEQWLVWLVADVLFCYLYIIKGIPFHGLLYGFYSVMAVLGYFKWLGMIRSEKKGKNHDTDQKN